MPTPRKGPPQRKKGGPKTTPNKHTAKSTETLSALRALERDRTRATLRRTIVRAEAVGALPRDVAIEMLAQTDLNMGRGKERA